MFSRFNGSILFRVFVCIKFKWLNKLSTAVDAGITQKIALAIVQRIGNSFSFSLKNKRGPYFFLKSLSLHSQSYKLYEINSFLNAFPMLFVGISRGLSCICSNKLWRFLRLLLLSFMLSKETCAVRAVIWVGATCVLYIVDKLFKFLELFLEKLNFLFEF